MDNFDLVQKVYHADFPERNLRFIKSECMLVSNEDGNWCGKGMYFWDNVSNAKYWVTKKHHRNSTLSMPTIVEASLRCKEADILDLTDDCSAQDLYQTALKFSECSGISMEGKSLGTIINFVHDSLVEDHQKTFSIVKLAGSYGKSDESNLIERLEKVYDGTRKMPHATSRLKIIYSVREEKFLFSKKLFDT